MIAWCVSARLYVSVPAQAHPTGTETMLPLRHEASTRTGAASPRKSCQSPPCQCYEFRLPVARVNPPRKTWRPGDVQCDNAQCQRMNPPRKTWRPDGVQHDDAQYQRMNPPCKTWRPGGVQCDDTQCHRMNPPCKTRRPGGVQHDDAQYQRMNPACKTWRPGGVQCDDTQCQRMNPPCKTARPRKSKTRTRDAIRPHNRERRAPLPRATSIVTNSGGPQPGMRVSATPCNRRRLPRERRTSLPGATTVSPNKSGGRKPPVAQNCIGNRNRPHPRDDRLLDKSGGRKPPWVQEPHLQLVAKAAGWLLASVSPPWVRSVERSAWRAVNHLQLRLGNHGWLTPAAPAARRSFAGK